MWSKNERENRLIVCAQATAIVQGQKRRGRKEEVEYSYIDHELIGLFSFGWKEEGVIIHSPAFALQ